MRKEIFFGLILAILLAVFLSPLASPNPDGLERVAIDKGFLEKSEGNEVISSPIPDYMVKGITNETVAGSAAGLIGTILTFAAAYGAAKISVSSKKASPQKKILPECKGVKIKTHGNNC